MTITAKNFNITLTRLVNSTTTQRDKLQALIIFGMNHCESTGDAGYLTKVMQAIIPVKAFRTQTAKEYIKAHVSNLTWTKLKDGNYGFAKLKKGTDCVVTMPDKPWYEFDNVGNAKPDIDILMQAKALQTRISKALNGESDKRIKDGQESLAIKLSQALDALLKLAPQPEAKETKAKQQAKVLSAQA